MTANKEIFHFHDGLRKNTITRSDFWLYKIYAVVLQKPLLHAYKKYEFQVD